MPLQLDDLAALDAPTLENTGQPLMLPVESIDEDPEQPRREFETTASKTWPRRSARRGAPAHLGATRTCRRRGAGCSTSARVDCVASKMAGMAEIPAFIDTTADSYDQVIENEQREGLSRSSWRCSCRSASRWATTRPRSPSGSAKPPVGDPGHRTDRAAGLAAAGLPRGPVPRHQRALRPATPCMASMATQLEAWAAQQPTITRDRLAEFRATLERHTAPVPAPAGAAAQPTGAADAADDDPGADAATQTPPRGPGITG